MAARSASLISIAVLVNVDGLGVRGFLLCGR
jgi:hypothetical protein